MNMFGMRWEEIFTLLLTAMGPVGITMSYMPIAQALPSEMRRQLARRTILLGFIVAGGRMLLGGGGVQRFQLSSAVRVLRLGAAFLVHVRPMAFARARALSGPAGIEK